MSNPKITTTLHLTARATLCVNIGDFDTEEDTNGQVCTLVRKSDGHRFKPQLVLEHQDKHEDPFDDLVNDEQLAREGFHYLEYQESTFEI